MTTESRNSLFAVALRAQTNHRHSAEVRDRSHSPWWLAAALLAAAFYSTLVLRAAFAAPDLVQDDARQHVFWAARFRDPTLFPNDFIADYFQAVAPIGYKAIYWLFASVGVDPLQLSRILPAIIGVAVAYLAFRLASALTNDRCTAFFASVFVCQVIWSKDDVISATPRAFAYPLLLWFLLALVRRRTSLALLVVALQGLIYPQLAFVCAGALVLGVLRWPDRRLQLSAARRDYFIALGALLIVAATVAPFAHAVAPYQPAMTRAEAMLLPEFQLHGRMQTFVDPIDYWLTSAPTGLFPTSLPVHIGILAALGIVLLLARKRLPQVKWPDKNAASIFARVIVASIALWAAAHVVLFRLHLPARYSQYSLRIVIPLLAVVPLQMLLQKTRTNSRLDRIAIAAVVLLVVTAPFAANKFPNAEFVPPRSAGLDGFLQQQPKNVLIATLRPMASTIPVFARRSVLVSAEHAIAYHSGYYRVIRQRGRDLIHAHLTSQAEDVRAFVEKYHVDLIIVPREPITPAAVAKLKWYREIISPDKTNSGAPILPTFFDSCKIWENDTDIVLDAHRIAQKIAANDISP